MGALGKIPVRKKYITSLGIICFVVILALGIVISLKMDATNEAKKVAAFEAEKAQKLADIVKENEKYSEEAAKKADEEHGRLQKLIDTGNLTTAEIKNDCTRLKNREAVILTGGANCSYSLRALGNTKMAVVFIKDSPDLTYGFDITGYRDSASSKHSLNYINEFLKREAARRNNAAPTITLDYFGPYVQGSPITGSNDDMENYQEIVNSLQSASLNNKVPEADYDMVHYVYLKKNSFRSFAMPSSHRAFTSANSYSTSGTFIHETLHLFGAKDKYNNGECQTKGRGDPFNPNGAEKNMIDIMCASHIDLDVLNINTITAREIGWQT